MREMKNNKHKKKLKKEVKVFLVILIAIASTFTMAYHFYLGPMLKEMNRVGFIQDKENPTEVIYKNKNHEIVYGPKKIKGKHYYFDEKTGHMKKGPIKQKDGIHYYGEDGAMVTGFVNQEDGKHYYQPKTGIMLTGVQKIDGEKYVFEDNGIMKTNSFCRGMDGNEKHVSYLDENGHQVKGRRNIDGVDRYFDENGNIAVDTEQLQQGVQQVLNNWSGDISFYFKDLQSNQSFSINDHTFYPCCMIKVPSLITIFNAIAEGRITRSEQVNHWIDLMIRISDNTSFNNLMAVLGGGNPAKGVAEVTQTAHDLGMNDTYARHGLEPGENTFSTNGKNQSSPHDLGIAFEKIYRHEVATPELCDEMIEILKSCDDHDELEAGLPAGTPFANKTGCADALYHDGGIVYGPTNDYIIVCFSNGASYMKMMSAVSEYVYNYMDQLIPEGV